MLLKKDIIKQAPENTGVYIFKDKKGKTLYIGKAKNLKKRLLSYINYKKSQTTQIFFLLREAKDFDYFITKSEREALLLENSLIKQKKPKYNIKLKDGKSYSSIRLNPKEKTPRICFTRQIKNDGAIYYGPFTSSEALKKTKQLIQKIFSIRDCTEQKFKAHSERPCLNYYTDLCSGPCANKVSVEEYVEAAKEAATFLRGGKTKIVSVLKENMKRASKECRYEKAARYRDRITTLEKHLDSKMLIGPNTKDKDIIGFIKEGSTLQLVNIFFRNGTIVDKVEYNFKNQALTETSMVREFVNQFYAGGRPIPREIITPYHLEDKAIIEDLLSERRGAKVKLIFPKKGQNLRLLELATASAQEALSKTKKVGLCTGKLLKNVKELLLLSIIPSSIECFDVSNIQGGDAVASVVRFDNGQKNKEGYRRYKIKTVNFPNDYGMMEEVLLRRMKRGGHEGWDLPKLILVDGGRGQLNIAQRIIEKEGYSDSVDVIAIAKGRVGGEVDKFYVYGGKDPIILNKNSKELMFLMKIRDEAHRFAITYHRSLRKKRHFQSKLDSIPGIGNKRKKDLIKHFGGIIKIKNASLDRILEVPGISNKIAKEIKIHLNN